MPRICLVTVANDFLPLLIERLPPSVHIAGSRPMFDRAAVVLRLEGDGLPGWCNEPSNGGEYSWAMVNIAADDRLNVLPLTLNKSVRQRIEEGFTNPN